MADSDTINMFNKIGIGKALTMAQTLFTNRKPLDLEILISRWSTETDTFVAAWGEFGPSLENVAVLTSLLFVGDTGRF